MRRVGYPGLLFTFTFFSLLTSGGLLMAYWRMLHLHDQQQTEFFRENRQFHQNLLADLHHLVNQSAPQATEDLCQVRFRLREEDGWGYPLEDFSLDLYRMRDNERELLQRATAGKSLDPTVNFGLVEPGNYRLEVANSLGMTCRHEFRVLPGVPVDRAILCPRHPPPAVPLSLKLPWPMEWKSLPVIAVYHLEPKARIIGRWKWKPSPKRQFHRWIVRGPAPAGFSEEHLCEALPAQFFTHPIPPQIEGPEVGEIHVPCRHCQVTAISFLLSPQEKQQPPIYLGSYAFTDERQGPSKYFDVENTIWIPQAGPHWEFDEDEPTSWEIRLPRQIVQQILTRVESELRRNQSATRESVPERPFWPGRLPINRAIWGRRSS